MTELLVLRSFASQNIAQKMRFCLKRSKVLFPVKGRPLKITKYFHHFQGTRHNAQVNLQQGITKKLGEQDTAQAGSPCTFSQPLSEYGFEYGLKTEMRQFSTNFHVSPAEKERKHTFVRAQIEYGFDCFQAWFGLVVSTVWIGSKYGFVILSDENASESHMQNSTRTVPYSLQR